MTRGSSNKNETGNSDDRRRRKQWLLDTFGDGETCLCSFDCEAILTFETITVDRYPIRKIDGGTFRRENIRPSCAFHNSQDGSLEMHRRLGHKLREAA